MTMNANRKYDWVLKPREAEVVRQFIDKMLLPNSEKIRAIAARGEIPVVCFEPMGDMLDLLGCTPSEPIVAMAAVAKRNLRKLPDSKPWIDKKLAPGEIKIFGVVHLGTFLFTWVSGHDLFVEPGSLDDEWKH